MISVPLLPTPPSSLNLISEQNKTINKHVRCEWNCSTVSVVFSFSKKEKKKENSSSHLLPDSVSSLHLYSFVTPASGCMKTLPSHSMWGALSFTFSRRSRVALAPLFFFFSRSIAARLFSEWSALNNGAEISCRACGWIDGANKWQVFSSPACGPPLHHSKVNTELYCAESAYAEFLTPEGRTGTSPRAALSEICAPPIKKPWRQPPVFVACCHVKAIRSLS